MKAGVSGSIGVTSGLGRASGGTSLSKGFGSSLSPEARFSGASSKFSSRSLSMFNKDAISSAPKSIFNVTQGREAKPQFASSTSLRVGKSIVDIARPISPTVPKFSGPRNEFGIKLNLNQAREVKSPAARVKALEPKRGMFDVSKPVVPREMVVPFSAQKTDVRVVRPMEVKASKPTVQASPFKDTVILWQNPNMQHRITPERKTRETVVGKSLKSLESSTQNQHKKASVEGKVHHAPTSKRVELKHLVRISPMVSPDKLPTIKRDIKDAKKMVQTIVRARNVSYTAAVEEIAQVLAKKYEGSLQILPAVQVQPKIETKTDFTTKTQTQPKAEQAVMAQPTERTQEIAVDNKDRKKEGSENDLPTLIFYFKKDLKTKTKRIQDALFAARKLFSYKRDTDVITGADISYEIGKYSTPGQVSEVAKSIRPDGTLNTFIDSLKRAGPVSKIEEVERMIQEVSSEDAPVRLSFLSEGEQVGQEGAQKVYEGDIDGKRAYFEENGRAFGKFKRDKKNIMWFIPDPKIPMM